MFQSFDPKSVTFWRLTSFFSTLTLISLSFFPSYLAWAGSARTPRTVFLAVVLFLGWFCSNKKQNEEKLVLKQIQAWKITFENFCGRYKKHFSLIHPFFYIDKIEKWLSPKNKNFFICWSILINHSSFCRFQ